MSNYPLVIPQNRRVLVIDDLPSIHEDFQRILAMDRSTRIDLSATEKAILGTGNERPPSIRFEVESAFSGEQGAKRVEQAVAEERPFALAFVDVRMTPGWDGIETARRILEIDREVHVVLCTAYSDYAWDVVLDTLPDHHRLLLLKKPFDSAEAFQIAYSLSVKWELVRECHFKTEDLQRRVEARTAQLKASNEELKNARIAALNMMEDAVEGLRAAEIANEQLKAQIAERERVEASLRATAEKLGESEQRGQALIESLPDAVYIITDSKVERANQAGATLLRMDHPRLLEGKSLETIVHPDVLPTLNQRIQQLHSGQPTPAIEEKLVRSDGTSFDAEIRLAEIRYKDHASAVLILRDITEEKVLAEKMLRTQRLESIGTLAGGIAHDLNNVLAPILMSIELLRMQYSNPDADRILAMIQSSAQRGADMVKQVLTFARGLQGKPVRIQVGHLVKEVARMFKETFPKSIEVRTTVGPSPWTLTADPTQLHQVLVNLGVNARDAMPHGGVLTLSALNFYADETFARLNPEAKVGPYVVVSVSDTGTGIPAEIRDRIFEPFFTTKPADKGTGLGLSTVRGIVKGHGGFVTICSEVGQGAEFRVYLPAETSETVEAAPAEPKSNPIANGERVLVVDDEASVLGMTQRVLETLGYAVITAQHGAEALAICAQNRGKIHLMITDMTMPILDGAATIRAARLIDPALRIIGASGQGSDSETVKAAKLMVDAFLHKPYTAECLAWTVHDVLARR